LRFTVPHPIPYQGSKRRLAAAILSHVPAARHGRLVEPFAGSAAVTLAASVQSMFPRYLIGDALKPLIDLWDLVLEVPLQVASGYQELWERERAAPIEAYYEIRAEFNADHQPEKLLYLLARCVKNAVRFNAEGEFNQSPDKRRKGTRPILMRSELLAAHKFLSGRCETFCGDFSALCESAMPDDFFYLDPPYQGTSGGRDQRYIAGLSRTKLIEALELLNHKKVPFILSYDGTSGGKSYGEPLPDGLAQRLLLNVGRSSQATLNGRDDVTIEALYISHSIPIERRIGQKLSLRDFAAQGHLFAEVPL
jgi:DNA adenine methylase